MFTVYTRKVLVLKIDLIKKKFYTTFTESFNIQYNVEMQMCVS